MVPNPEVCWFRLTSMGVKKYTPKKAIPTFSHAFFGFKLNEIVCEYLKEKIFFKAQIRFPKCIEYQVFLYPEPPP